MTEKADQKLLDGALSTDEVLDQLLRKDHGKKKPVDKKAMKSGPPPRRCLGCGKLTKNPCYPPPEAA